MKPGHINKGLFRTVIFFTSVTIICLEVCLIQVFSLIQWHDFSSLIISIALLGFGISGSIIFIFKKQIERNIRHTVFICLIMYPFFLALDFIFYCKIPFNPYLVGIDTIQIFYFVLYVLLITVPFFFAASVICIAFLYEKSGTVYFYNLTGSGGGAILAVIFATLFHPFDIIIIVVALSCFTASCYSFHFRKLIRITVLCLTVFFVAGLYTSFELYELKRPSQYKSISRALHLPGSRIGYEGFSPHGVVQAVSAQGLRSTVGISLVSPYQIPVQKALFINGEGMSPVVPYSGDKEDLAYLHYVPTIIPYYISDQNNRKLVLIAGAGGGEGILRALLYRAGHIVALEMNPDIIAAMKGKYAGFSGNIYNHPQVSVVKKEIRSYIRTTGRRFDIIDMSMVDSFNTAVSGVRALHENYLYTVEGIQDYYRALKPHGILAVSRWILSPPRDSLKLIHISIKALQALGTADVDKHIICIRSLQSVILLISKSPFTDQQIRRAREFCTTRLFNIEYFPGMDTDTVKFFIEQADPVFYNAITAFSGKRDSRFAAGYPYDISVVTDDRPYYYNFFKWSLLADIIDHGTRKIPFTEWGYLTLVIVLGVLVCISLLGIVFPIVLIKRSTRYPVKFPLFLYFAGIGLAYFCIEVVFIQKMLLFLGDPVYSVSLVIAVLLIFSGIGSIAAEKADITVQTVVVVHIIIGCLIVVYSLVLDRLLMSCLSCNMAVKVILTVIVLSVPAVFMGTPFPTALSVVKQQETLMVPWAWGINSFFSVISIILASLLAMWFGFSFVLLFAAGLYICTGFFSRMLSAR